MRHNPLSPLIAAVAVVGLVAGCSNQGGGSDQSPDGAAQATHSAQAEATPLSTPELKKLLLTVDEVPTGGWKASGTDDDDDESTDHDSPGVCAMDFSKALGDTKNSPEAQKMFVRKATQSAFFEAIASTAKGRELVDSTKSQFAKCPKTTTFTESGQKQTVTTKPLSVGSVGNSSVCRSFTQRPEGLPEDGGYGKWCLVSDKNRIISIGTFATYTGERVKDAEFKKLLEAALTKMDRS